MADFRAELALSYYRLVATINEEHKVYLVQHRETGKFYVKKELDVFNAGVYRFLKAYPPKGTPQIRELIENGNTLTVIEEYISGETLLDKVQKKALPEPSILQYIIRLCEIVENLHRLNPPLIHRDIKPSNIIITPDDTVVLLDFNASKAYNPREAADTVLLGTHGYAAPEQYGFGSSSPQTDIYSIGAVLRELFTGRPCSPGLRSIIDRCLKMEPAERFVSVTELKSALLDCAGFKSVRGKKSGLPGFRTKTPWKMLLASVYYAAVILLAIFCWDGKHEVLWSTAGNFLIYVFLLLPVFIFFDLRGMQNWIPLCRHQNLFVRLLGMFLLWLALTAISLFLYLVGGATIILLFGS